MTEAQNRKAQLEEDNDKLIKKIASGEGVNLEKSSRINRYLAQKQLLKDNKLLEELHEGKGGDEGSLNLTLLNSVNLQYGNSKANSYAAKYAKIWLRKTQARRAAREEQ